MLQNYNKVNKNYRVENIAHAVSHFLLENIAHAVSHFLLENIAHAVSHFLLEVLRGRYSQLKKCVIDLWSFKSNSKLKILIFQESQC